MVFLEFGKELKKVVFIIDADPDAKKHKTKQKKPLSNALGCGRNGRHFGTKCSF